MCVNDLCCPRPLLFTLCRIAFRVGTKSLPYSVNIALIYFFIHLVNTVFSPQWSAYRRFVCTSKKKNTTRVSFLPRRESRYQNRGSATICKETILTWIIDDRPARLNQLISRRNGQCMFACMYDSSCLFLWQTLVALDNRIGENATTGFTSKYVLFGLFLKIMQTEHFELISHPKKKVS